MNLNNSSASIQSQVGEVPSVELLPQYERALVVLRLQTAVCKIHIMRTQVKRVYDAYGRAIEGAGGAEVEREMHRVRSALARAVGGAEVALEELFAVFEGRKDMATALLLENEKNIAQRGFDLDP